MKIKKVKPGKTKLGAVLKLVFGCFLLLAAGLLIAASFVFHFNEWHDFDPKLILECPEALMIYDSDNELVSVMGTEKRIWIGIDGISKHTIDAFISAEDARFYTHSGIDLYRIFGAAWADLKAGGYVQGASTISQQLIKLSHLSSEKTLDRKLEEAVLATKLESVFSKDEIMEMYLNYIYFGGGYYGIEAASLGYFGVHASELSAAQSAQLAGILKSPSSYAPHIDMEASVSRRNNVLRLMRDYGCLSEEEYSEAKNEECVLSPALPSERNALIDRALEEAERLTGITSDELLTGGYSLYLSLNSGIQEACESIFRDSSLFPSDNAQGALVVLDSYGGIGAMLGSRGEYSPGELNRAVDIERQPGSLIKPVLVYAPALEELGYNAATILEDVPTSFGDYSPRNSDDKYYGAVTLRTAVTKSLNVPAVRVLETLGVRNAATFAQSIGVDFRGEALGLPLALGGFSHGVSPLEMAGAYSSFSRGGLYVAPHVIKSICRNGEEIYKWRYSGRRVMDETNSYLLTSMLQSVASEGTGKRLSDTGLPLAAKTGTSIDGNGVRDAWCAAYTRDYTAVIWMGTDSAALGSLPESSVGGNNTAVILGKLFKELYAECECSDFSKPENVKKYDIDLSSSGSGAVYLAGEFTPEEYVITELFAEGSEPESVNPYWERPKAPSETGWSIDEHGRPVISFTADSELLSYVIIRYDQDGGEKILCEIQGKKGYIGFTDETVESGGSYSYVIIAVHPELKENDGSRMKSEPSRRMRVVVPFC